MNRWRLMFIRLLESFWLGSAIFLMAVAAPAAFRAAGGPSSAADVVGAMLNRWHYIAIAVPLVLLIMNLRAGRGPVVALLTFTVFLASLQGMVDLRARWIRVTSVVPISSLERGHPVRRQFMRLHGISMVLLSAQVVTGLGIVALGALTSWREQMGMPALPPPKKEVAVAPPPPEPSEAEPVSEPEIASDVEPGPETDRMSEVEPGAESEPRRET